MLPVAGNYQRVRIGERSVYESQGGALVFSLDCVIDERTSIIAYKTLVNKDGAVNTRTVETLREVFGWDGCDPFWLCDSDLSQVLFDIVVEDETGNDGKIRPKVQWINPPGRGGNGGGVKAMGDRNAILARYGAKFRAVAGGSAPKAAPKPPPPPKSEPPPPPSSPANVQPCSMQDAWNALMEQAKGSPRDKVEKVWHDVLKSVAKGRRQTELTQLEWGEVRAKCLERDDDIPY